MVNKKILSIFLTLLIIMSSIIVGVVLLLLPERIVSDRTPPTVIIHSPEDGNYNSATQLLNISASDNSGIDTIWYNWNSINVTYISP